MRREVVAVGTGLLPGRIVDTDSSRLGEYAVIGRFHLLRPGPGG